MEHEFSRTELLIGKEALERLKQCKVAVFGLGGVGSFVVEALVRSGICHFVLIDDDKVSLTNLNRQLIATRKTLGQPKVEVMRERILEINPQAEVETHQVFVLPETASGLVRPDMDYIVDAIDTVTAKIELAVRARALGIPIISCMGAGNKLDPTRFEIDDIFRTSYCPLSKVMRRELKKRGIDSLKVVYSKEEPRPALSEEIPDDAAAGRHKRRVPGSIAFVPSVAGLFIAGEVVKDLIAGIAKPADGPGNPD